MNRYTKEQAIRIITRGAALYKENLSGKDILFISLKDGETTALEVTFTPYNFLHLTGVVLTRQISAMDFYNKCLEKKLSPADFNFSADGTTQLKLEIFLGVMTKNLSARMYGDYSGGGVNLYTEKIAGGHTACMGFKKAANGKYFPNTLLNADVRDVTVNTRRIIVAYQKDSSQKEYSELVYKAKNFDFSAVKYPEKYENLLKYINDDND